VDYSVKTPLQFDRNTGSLTSARLQLQVDLEVAAQQQQQQQQMTVMVDLCLADGAALLPNMPTRMEQVHIAAAAANCKVGCWGAQAGSVNNSGRNTCGQQATRLQLHLEQALSFQYQQQQCFPLAVVCVRVCVRACMRWVQTLNP
jgi:hypothetical protein